jgi:hypothetical protein
VRAAEALVGLCALALFAIALPAGLHFAGSAPELSVTVRAPGPHAVDARPGGPPAPATAGPPELLPRLERAGEVDLAGPGLGLRTWQITYGRRWERQVTFPVLAGPFDPEGKPWPCSIAIRLGPGFFDDGKPGGEDVEAVLDRAVRAQFPMDVLGLHFAEVATTAIRVRPAAGALEVSGSITLADRTRHGDPTQFSFSAKIVLREQAGDLAARLQGLSVRWTGRTRQDPLVALASMFLDVDEQARGVLAGKLQGTLSILKLPREPFPLTDSRPSDKFRIRLCGHPSVDPSGLAVRLRLVAEIAEPRVDPRVPGPTHLDAPPELPAADPGAGNMEAAASPAAVHQALYALWQSGELGAWGRRGDVLASLRDKIQDRVAFDVTAVDLRLPPSVLPPAPGDEGFRVRFGDLALGRLDDGRLVAAHGDILGRARVVGGRLGLAGTLADVRVNCVSGRPDAWTMTPCFSDVVPVLREGGLTSEGLPLDLPVPDRLLRIALVLGTDLVLRDLRAETRAGQILLKGDARLVPRGKGGR